MRARSFLLASVALHALLGGYLYYFGTYQLELRRQDEQVAASTQATTQARSARRVEDLQKIKELLEKSAQRASDGQSTSTSRPDPAPAAGHAPQPVPQDPREQLKLARELAKSIDDISRDIRAEEQARLTDIPKEQARADLDARMDARTPPVTAQDDPIEEIARLEAQARQILAQRAEELQRKQDGVAVSVGDADQGGGKQSSGNQGGGATGAQPNGAALAGSGSGSGGGVAGQGDQEQAARQIAEFMGGGGVTSNAPPSKGYGYGGAIFNMGQGQVPSVSAGRAVKARGRMLGAGGQYANRIYLNSWYVIGPFAGRADRNVFRNPKYPPEDAVLLDAVYRGKDQRLVKWEYVSNARYPLKPRDYAEDAVYYGYTEVLMDQDRDLMVWIGADDDAQVYLNDRIIWNGKDINKQWFFEHVYTNRAAFDRDYNRSEGHKVVRFKKGRNKIFFKLSNGPMETFFSMVLTQPDVR